MNDADLGGLVSAYILNCEQDRLYSFRYYYVNYKVFRPGSFGKYSNDDIKNKPYVFSVMQTRSKWSENTYVPYLKTADPKNDNRDYYGQRLVYGSLYITAENDGYSVKDATDNSVMERVIVKQNEEGIDCENRIEKLAEYIRENGLI